MTESTCRACGRVVGILRPLPWPDEGAPLRFSIAPVCESCIAPSVEALRETVLRADLADSDDADEVDRVARLITFLRARGLAVAGADGLAGPDAIRRSLLAVLDSLERQMVCSQCWSRGPESRTHVVPYFDHGAGRYVASLRCDGCVDAALAEAMARVLEVDGARELDTLGELLREHGVVVHEWMRGDDPERLRRAMVSVLGSMSRPAMQRRLLFRAARPIPPPRSIG